MPVALFAQWPGISLYDYYKGLEEEIQPCCALFFRDIRLLQMVCFSERVDACSICSLKESNEVNQLIK